MKRKKRAAIQQASVPLGNMGWNVPWTMSMAMKRWEQGDDVFSDGSTKVDPVDYAALLERIENAAGRARKEMLCPVTYPEEPGPIEAQKQPWWKRLWRKK